jgi:HK97 family phage major capsid protein
MRIADLREARASKISEMRALVAGAESAGRDLTADESTRFDALRSDAENIEARLGRAEAIADMERRTTAASPLGEFARESRAYSLAKAVQEFSAGRLSGREAEVQSELSRGREARGLLVPTSLLLGERRDGQVVSNDTLGGYGVATDLAAMGDRFRPALRVEALGATVLRNLVGNLDLPNLAGSGTAEWVAENTDVTRSTATFEAVSMSPKTVGAEYRLSRKLMLQNAQSIEEILRRDLGLLLATALDAAAINGSGAGAEPEGILENSDVSTVVASVALCDTTADLMAALELDDVMGTGAFLTNPTVMATARKLKDGDAHLIPIADTFHNQRVEVSSQVPATLGGGSDSAVIWGLWSELVVGYWSAVDILVNPFHADVASNGGVLLHAFLDADIGIRHPKAFAFSLV